MCSRYAEEDFVDFRQGRLSPSIAAEMQTHLAACEDCRVLDETVSGLLRLKDEALPQPSEAAQNKMRDLIAVRTAEMRTGIAKRRRLAWRAALAAGILIAVGLFSWPTLVAARPMGTLAEMNGDVVVSRNGQSRTARHGMDLLRDDVIKVADGAVAVVSLTDSTRVELGSNTTVKFTGSAESSLFLQHGFLAIDAAPRSSANALRVATEDAEAEVLGTRFALATAGKTTNLRVDEGKVQFTRMSDAAELMVPAGHHASTGEAGRFEPVSSRSGEVLVIVSRKKALPHWKQLNELLEQRLIGEQLQKLAFRVVVKDHAELTPTDLVGRSLVVVSLASPRSGLEESLERVGLPDLAVPVVCLEGDAYRTFGMTGPTLDKDYGWKTLEPLKLLRPEHPLAKGLLPEDLAWFGGPAGVGPFGKERSNAWGRPAPAAAKIMAIASNPDYVTLFAYEPGGLLINGKRAPARRVATRVDPQRAHETAAPCWKIFDAAVQWCAEPAAVAQNRQSRSASTDHLAAVAPAR